MAALTATVAGLGIDLAAQTGITLDIEPRPRKSPMRSASRFGCRATFGSWSCPGVDTRTMEAPARDGPRPASRAYRREPAPGRSLRGRRNGDRGVGVPVPVPARRSGVAGRGARDAPRRDRRLARLRRVPGSSTSSVATERSFSTSCDCTVARRWCSAPSTPACLASSPAFVLRTRATWRMSTTGCMRRYLRAWLFEATVSSALRDRYGWPGGDPRRRSIPAGHLARRTGTIGGGRGCPLGYDHLDWRPVLRQIRAQLIGEMSGYGGPNITTRAGSRKV